MAYEKRKVKKLPKMKENGQKNTESTTEKIKMKPKRSSEVAAQRRKEKPIRQRRRPLTVIDGGETERRKIKLSNIITASISLVVVATLVLAQILTPTGLIEFCSNRIADIGYGKFPTEVSGAKVLDMQRAGGRVNILTDTELSIYNRHGKAVTTVQHGYSAPVLRVSAERTLMYDCGGSDVRVDSLSKNIYKGSYSSKVITADICRSGEFAVVTEGVGYAATMTVYSHQGNPVYRYNSSGDIISAVAVEPSGKRAAAFTVTSVNGKYKTTVNIFSKDGKTLSSVEADGICVLHAYSAGDRLFGIGADGVISFEWDGSGLQQLSYPSINFIDTQSEDGLLVAVGAENSTSTVYIIGRDGKQSYRMELTHSIVDGVIGREGVYLLSGNTVSFAPFDGGEQTLGNIGYEHCHLSAFGRSVITVSDMKLEKLKR